MNNSTIGSLAEKIAIDYERCSEGLFLKKIIKLVSDSPSAGYDIEVIESDGIRKCFKAIEVKTWNEKGHFFISSNEVETLKRLGNSGWIYLVDINKKKVVRTIQNPFSKLFSLKPITYKFFY